MFHDKLGFRFHTSNLLSLYGLKVKYMLQIPHIYMA